MNKSNSRITYALGAIIVLVCVGSAAYYLSSHKSNNAKQTLAAGYETQALTAPFTFTSKTWDQASATWRYNYTADVTPPEAVAAAKSQLSQGAYQVDARRPDVIGAGSATATLYRDLITEDVTLKVQIVPSQPTEVEVTISPIQGN